MLFFVKIQNRFKIKSEFCKNLNKTRLLFLKNIIIAGYPLKRTTKKEPTEKFDHENVGAIVESPFGRILVLNVMFLKQHSFFKI